MLIPPTSEKKAVHIIPFRLVQSANSIRRKVGIPRKTRDAVFAESVHDKMAFADNHRLHARGTHFGGRRLLVPYREGLVQDVPETSVLDEFIVHQIDEVVRVVYCVNHFSRARIVLIKPAPLLFPESKRFVLTREKRQSNNFKN